VKNGHSARAGLGGAWSRGRSWTVSRNHGANLEAIPIAIDISLDLRGDSDSANESDKSDRELHDG